MENQALFDRIRDFARARAKRHEWVSRVYKAGLGILGSSVATIAQFADIPDTGPKSYQVVGICAAALAFFGALFTALTEVDASKELQAAQEAIDDFNGQDRALQELQDDIYRLQGEAFLTNTVSYFVQRAREYLEQLLLDDHRDLELVLGDLLHDVGKQSVPVCLGFSLASRWTVCVYKAEFNEAEGRYQLRCCEHLRAVDCDLANARIWPAGVGVAGIAFAQAQEVVVPEFSDPAVQSILRLEGVTKPGDEFVYRSLAAVPIKVGRDKLPWGVIVATNDVSEHFDSDAAGGAKRIDSLRALAGIVALAVAVCRTPPAGTANGSLTP